MMSRLVITFLPRSKCLLILWLQSVTICSDFGVPKIKSATVSTVSPSICHEVMGPDAMILVFWMLSFKPTFWLSSFSFIKRLFSSSSLSVRRMVLSAYLRLLIFHPAILIPAFASSSPVFLMMYSAYKLKKQGDNTQPWCTPSPIWNQSVNDSHLELTLLRAALPLWIRAGSGWPIDSGESESAWLPEVKSQTGLQPPPWCPTSLTLGKLNCYTMRHAHSSWIYHEWRETEVFTNHQDLLGNHVIKTLRKYLQPQSSSQMTEAPADIWLQMHERP